METNSAQAPAMNEPYGQNLGVMEKIRNSRTGQWLAEVAVSAGVILGGGTAADLAFNAEPVIADNEPGLTNDATLPSAPDTDLRRPIINSYNIGVHKAIAVQNNGINYLSSATLSTEYDTPTTQLIPEIEQECIDAALAMPSVDQKPTMYHAGIRPLDPHHFHSQAIVGQFEYLQMQEGCAPEFARVSHGQVQIQKRGERKIWINNGPPNNPVYESDQAGGATLDYGPNHAWPEYLFSMCEPGEGFQKARVILRNALNDTRTHEVVAQKKYVLPVQIHGNCQDAVRSKNATKNIRATWGK